VQRIAVIGNSGGGKSTLARKLAAKRGLPYAEIDALLWRPNWELTRPIMGGLPPGSAGSPMGWAVWSRFPGDCCGQRKSS